MNDNNENWKSFARDLTGWELNERILDGNDVAILPVGSMEFHGPQLPLGTDTYIAEAVGKLVAPRVKGTVFDTISYSWPGMTKYSSPTISMTMDMETSYIRMVCDQLLRIGLRRIYVIQFHGPGFALTRLSREFFEENGSPLVFYGLLRMPNDSKEACLKNGTAWEASLYAAATKFLGVPPVIYPNAVPSTPDATLPPPAAEAHQKICETGGVVGMLGTNDFHHGVFDGRVDVDFGMDTLKMWAESIASSAPSLTELCDAWQGVELSKSWPSSIQKK